jgi:hypothetical protein
MEPYALHWAKYGCPCASHECVWGSGGSAVASLICNLITKVCGKTHRYALKRRAVRPQNLSGHFR